MSGLAPTPPPTPQKPTNLPMDRAQWSRFSKDNKDRCIVCNHKADVVVRLESMEVDAERGTGRSVPRLAKQDFLFCNEHGVLRYGNAVGQLQVQQGRAS